MKDWESELKDCSSESTRLNQDNFIHKQEKWKNKKSWFCIWINVWKTRRKNSDSNESKMMISFCSIEWFLDVDCDTKQYSARSSDSSNDCARMRKSTIWNVSIDFKYTRKANKSFWTTLMKSFLNYQFNRSLWNIYFLFWNKMKKRRITYKDWKFKTESLIINADDYKELIEQLWKFLFFDEIIKIERLYK